MHHLTKKKKKKELWIFVFVLELEYFILSDPNWPICKMESGGKLSLGCLEYFLKWQLTSAITNIFKCVIMLIGTHFTDEMNYFNQQNKCGENCFHYKKQNIA